MTTVEKKGGIVMEGGRIGKLLTQGVASAIGATAGSSMGFMGEIGGAYATGKAATVLRGMMHQREILGVVDRALIHLTDTKAESSATREAIQFLQKYQEGLILVPANDAKNLLAKVLQDDRVAGNAKESAEVMKNQIWALGQEKTKQAGEAVLGGGEAGDEAAKVPGAVKKVVE
jgi:hypothetical protein